MGYSRSTIVKQAQSWIGCKESDDSYKEIIDVYNAHTPLARSYKVKYTDAWCATFVSAVSIKCGYTAIIPTECSCAKMITLLKNLSEWEEDDSYTPSAGDLIFYDWDDTTGTTSDNTGNPDHVGIVEKVSGTTITVIEGNYSNAVKRRTITVNAKYIRGYGVPKYSGSTTTSSSSSSSSTSTSTSTKAAASSTADPKTVWTYLLGKIGNAYGVAGLMGNLYAESGLVPNNLQNSYNTKLGYTDAAYTAAVDDGSYTNFSSDSAGYGLAQWTYSTRKKALKTYADAQNASIGNLSMQLAFLYKELSESYSSVLTTLKNATSVLEASNAVLTKYEKPANTGTSVQTARAAYGQKYYDTYAGSSSSSLSSSSSSSSSYKAGTKVTLSGAALYASATATSKAGTKTGTFYLWDGTVTNKRIRITTASSYTGVSGKVTGWIEVSAISSTSTSTSSSSTTTITTLQAASKKESGYSSGKSYKTTARLNLRYGPSSAKLSNGKDKYGIITTLASGATVKYYGYYDKDSDGVKWLYVTSSGKTGWVSSAYLK